MKSTIKLISAACSMILLSACGVQEASESNVKSISSNILSCSSKDAKFEITHPIYHVAPQAALTFKAGGSRINMACLGKPSPKMQHPDASNVIWECQEIRPAGSTSEGSYRTKVSAGGLSGKTMAQVTIDQMYPLAPKLLTTLICQ